MCACEALQAVQPKTRADGSFERGCLAQASTTAAREATECRRHARSAPTRLESLRTSQAFTRRHSTSRAAKENSSETFLLPGTSWGAPTRIAHRFSRLRCISARHCASATILSYTGKLARERALEKTIKHFFLRFESRVSSLLDIFIREACLKIRKKIFKQAAQRFMLLYCWIINHKLNSITLLIN